MIDIGTTDEAVILDMTKDEGIKISLGPLSKLQCNERPLVDLILGLLQSCLIKVSPKCFILENYVNIASLNCSISHPETVTSRKNIISSQLYWGGESSSDRSIESSKRLLWLTFIKET